MFQTIQKVQKWILKFSVFLEICVAVVIMIAILMSSTSLIYGLVDMAKNCLEPTAFQKFLGLAFNIVIGIEFIRMLCRHNLSSVVEVLLFAIARQLIIEHTSPVENLVTISAIAILFLIRKYLFIPNLDDKN